MPVEVVDQGKLHARNRPIQRRCRARPESLIGLLCVQRRTIHIPQQQIHMCNVVELQPNILGISERSETMEALKKQQETKQQDTNEAYRKHLETEDPQLAPAKQEASKATFNLVDLIQGQGDAFFEQLIAHAYLLIG